MASKFALEMQCCCYRFNTGICVAVACMSTVLFLDCEAP